MKAWFSLRLILEVILLGEQKNDVIPSLWLMRGTESPQSHKGWSRGAGPAEQTEHLLAGVGEHLCDVST